MTDTGMRIAQLISTGVACAMLAVTWRSRSLGRFALVALFAWAAQVNFRTALTALKLLDAPFATTLWREAAAWLRIGAGRLTVTH